MSEAPTAAPALSSQPEYIPVAVQSKIDARNEDIRTVYEVDRTIAFISEHKSRRIALQFPDSLLPFSTHVVEVLTEALHEDIPANSVGVEPLSHKDENVTATTNKAPKFYILADTSYGSCCVDEIAAEHANADCIVHYGQACLSPTSRLPVLHIFTTKPLDIASVVYEFKKTFAVLDSKIILMSSLPYITQLPKIAKQLCDQGYSSIYETSVVHDPSALIPNRTSPTTSSSELQSWSLLHIDEPLTSLVLTLASRTASLHVYHTTERSISPIATTAIARRRYALLSHIRSAGVIGILVNTLSANHYLPVIATLKKLIKGHDKKSYMFVVGKVNAAKVANFAEVECWVVVGCWESSIIDEGKEFWRACVTPFEARLALEGGEGSSVQAWRADMESFLSEAQSQTQTTQSIPDGEQEDIPEQDIDDEESAPPIFDLRTGKYVSSSAPLRAQRTNNGSSTVSGSESTALVPTSKDKTLTLVNGSFSPAAAFLKEKRQWKGLGSDYYENETEKNGAIVEEGRSGIARGYKVGDISTTT